MKFYTVFVILAVLSFSESSLLKKTEAQEYDMYVLAVQWPSKSK